jgi:hypothetical protein
VYDELVAWCRTYQSAVPPGSLFGAAIRYLVNYRIALARFRRRQAGPPSRLRGARETLGERAPPVRVQSGK